jgi:hypothetical protein
MCIHCYDYSNSMSVSSSSPAFAGLACDPILVAPPDEIEYEGWLMIKGEPVTSLDQNNYSAAASEDAFTVQPLSQNEQTQLSLDDSPSIIDSGATVHISLKCSNFLSLFQSSPTLLKVFGDLPLPLLALVTSNFGWHKVCQSCCVIHCLTHICGVSHRGLKCCSTF